MRTKTITEANFTATIVYPDGVAYMLDNQYIEIEYAMSPTYMAEVLAIAVDSYTLSVPAPSARSGRVVFPLRGIIERLTQGTAVVVEATLQYSQLGSNPQTYDLLNAGTTFKTRKGVTLAGRRHNTDFAAVLPAGVFSLERHVATKCVVIDDVLGVLGVFTPDTVVDLKHSATFCAFAEIPSLDYTDTTMTNVQGYCVGVVNKPVEIDGDVAEMAVIKFCSVNVPDEEKYSFFFLGDDPAALGSANLDVYGYSDPDDLSSPLTAIDRVNDGTNDMVYSLIPTDSGDVVSKRFYVYDYCADAHRYMAVRYTNADGVQRYAVGKVLSRDYSPNGAEVRMFGQLNGGVRSVQYSAGVAVTLAFGGLRSTQHFEDLLFADDIEVETVDGWVSAVLTKDTATVAVSEKYDKTLKIKLQQ